RADRWRRVRLAGVDLQLDDRCQLLLLGGHDLFLCRWLTVVLVALQPGWGGTRRYDAVLGPRDRLNLGHLVETELHLGLPAEDGYQHLQLLRAGADLGDGRRQGRERAIHDGHRLALGEVDLGRG